MPIAFLFDFSFRYSVLFRTAQFLYGKSYLKPLFAFAYAIHTVNTYITGIQLHPSCNVGGVLGLRIILV